MRVEQVYDPDRQIMVDHYIQEGDEHLVMTGPITGIRTLSDGTAVNLSPAYAAVQTLEQVAEVHDLIGQHWADTGHPNDVDQLNDPDTPDDAPLVPVQRPFVFEKSTGELVVGVGVPQGEHPLDEANGITALDADPRIAQAGKAAAKNQED